MSGVICIILCLFEFLNKLAPVCGLGGATWSKAQRYVVVKADETATASNQFGLNFLKNLPNSTGIPIEMATFQTPFPNLH